MSETRPVVIAVDRVTHDYGEGPARHRVLDGASLAISEGELVILTGPSGSGKTTLLTLIGALRSIQQGEITMLGHSLKTADARTLRSVRQRTRFIFQKHNLINSLTALGNVEIALKPLPETDRDWNRSRATAMLQEVGLAHRRDAYPAELSGGEQQRVAVARAIASIPDILIADEPTAALDRDAGRVVVELIKDLAGKFGCGVLMATHDERIFEFADRRLGIEDGRITEAPYEGGDKTG